MHPVKAKVKPIREYPIKFEMSVLPNNKKEIKISCFNLDNFRNKKVKNNKDNKIELE